MKLRYKIFGIILGIIGGLALAMVLDWYLEKKNGRRAKRKYSKYC